MSETAATLRVKGTGSIKLHPDTTCININIKGTYKQYSDCIKHSAEDTEALRETLDGLGFERESLKTVSFNVDERYEGYNDKNGNWRQRFMGYEFHHSLRISFPSDNVLLGKTLYALANSPVDPQFNISYTLADKEAAKNLLIQKAVEDAKQKAALLAEAAGVSLCRIMSIDYSWGELPLELPMVRMAKPMLAKANGAVAEDCCDMGINPDDITAEDNVTVVWEIK